MAEVVTLACCVSGANIMAPGLTSAGGAMDDVPAESAVLVMAEGKEQALALGLTKLSTEDMYVASLESKHHCSHWCPDRCSRNCSRKVNKGIAVETIHYLNDGFWKIQSLGS